MSDRKPYGAALAMLAVIFAVAAVYVAAPLFGDGGRPRGGPPFEGADTFTVRDPQDIRPPAEAYRRFDASDLAWRARYAPPISWQSLVSRPWHPSDRQILTDSAYRLVTANRLDEAAALLSDWIARSPNDVALRIELARLLNTLGRGDEAVAHYRRALSIRPARDIRAELAAVLLDARHYDAAIAELRGLLAVDADNPAYRLALARALLWSDRGREAEPEIARLAARSPGDTTLRAMLRAARASFDPAATEARVWVAEEPQYTPYRLALARALVSEHRADLARAQFDTLLRSGETLALLREAAAAYGTARDSSGAARLLGRALALAPADDSLRLQYARALAWSGDGQRAIDEYSTLIAHRPTAELLLARGQLYVWAGDERQGASDLATSAALRPSYEAYVLLGDIHRWASRFREARDMYNRALALRPDDARTRLALADLRRAETLYLASLGEVDDGWSLLANYVEDNAGFLFLSAGVRGGFALDPRTTVTVGFEQRRVSQRTFAQPERFLYGFAANVSGRRTLGRHLALTATAGYARHALVRDIPFGSLALAWWAGRGSATVQVGQGPAYGSLMTLSAISPAGASGSERVRALVATRTQGSVTVPVGAARVTIGGERMRLSDGNARNMVNAAVRVPVVAGIAAIYEGGMLGYEQQSERYWDPRRYTAHAVGIEVSGQPMRHLSVTARALPGIARVEQSLGGSPASTAPGALPAVIALPARNAFQFGTNADVRWRTSTVDIGAGAGYSRGRAGGYQSLTGALEVRVRW